MFARRHKYVVGMKVAQALGMTPLTKDFNEDSTHSSDIIIFVLAIALSKKQIKPVY